MAYVSAGPGSAATTVAAMGDVVTVLLAFGNVPVVVLLAATAVVGLRWHALPGWLGWFSALAAVLHLAPVVGVVLETGPLSPEGVGALPGLPRVRGLAAGDDRGAGPCARSGCGGAQSRRGTVPPSRTVSCSAVRCVAAISGPRSVAGSLR